MLCCIYITYFLVLHKLNTYACCWDENLGDSLACMLIINSYVFLLKLIKPIAQYNYAYIYCFIASARADTRSQEVTWQNNINIYHQ